MTLTFACRLVLKTRNNELLGEKLRCSSHFGWIFTFGVSYEWLLFCDLYSTLEMIPTCFLEKQSTLAFSEQTCKQE